MMREVRKKPLHADSYSISFTGNQILSSSRKTIVHAALHCLWRQKKESETRTMTSIRRSSMRVHQRYRAPHSTKNERSKLVIMNAVFLVIFTIYQIILSKSNGGEEDVVATYRTFLKGGSSPRDATDIIHDGDNTVQKNQPETQKKILEDESMKENKIPEIFIQHDPFSPENEVKDFFGEEDGGESEKEVKFIPGVFGEEDGADLFQEKSEEVYVFDTDHQMFHNYYSGKSGKVVEEMLMAHAYIFHQNATYGGCCGTRSVKMDAHEDLLDALGLKEVLRFRCPRDFIHDTKTRRSVIPQDHYTAEDTHIWTPDYVDYLRTLVTYPERRHKEYTIVVHMLRGNTSPCKEKSRGFHSYLPNLHYQNLIDKYMKPGARVIIYTSAKSFESLSEFRNRGYEVNTGTSLKETWKEFVTADVFIMSRSDFSMVPAMVAKGIVVYTPFWHHTLRRWVRVSRSMMKESDDETIRLRKTLCNL